MYPRHFTLGPLTVGFDQITMAAGLFLVALLVRRRIRGLGLGTGDLIDLLLAGLIGGALGAKLYHLLPLWIRGVHSLGYLLEHWSQGSGFYGGFLGGMVALTLVLKKKEAPILKTFDPIAMYLPLGFALGKLGCFLGGCCYGRPAEWPPGLRFPPGSLAYETQRAERAIPPGAATSLPVHPTQLYELGFSLALFGILYALYRRSKRPGETFLAWVAGYSAWRIFIEAYRTDPDRHNFGFTSWSDSQVTGTVLLVLAVGGWVALWRQHRAVPPPPAAA